MKIVLLGVVIVLLVLGIRVFRRNRRRKRQQVLPFKIPHEASIRTIPLLGKEEIALYNLLQLVAQERYLVFAQVPLWSVVAVDAGDRARSQILRHIALKRVDFVLIHPGTCLVECAVQIEHESPGPGETEGQRVIESVLEAAGIKLMKLQSKQSYSLPDLTARLELSVEE
ncbi:MAG: DUF2726 domain-containing protein [Nitrospira sp.]|nr:DUF2726 domain-containing protein [Nitrospira sp.]